MTFVLHDNAVQNYTLFFFLNSHSLNMLNSFFHAVFALTKGSRANLHLGNQYYSHLACCILQAPKASIIQALLQDNTLKYLQ